MRENLVQKLVRPLLIGSIATFLLCLVLPGYCVGSHDCPIGVSLLEGGWLSLLVLQPYWLANPLLLLAWYFYFRGKTGLGSLMAWGALIVALSFIFAGTIPLDEAGTIGSITSLNIGYYLWVTSMALACAVSLVYIFIEAKRKEI
ncbi:MAG: hypothetical protein JO142_21615 [Burkholderiales bacterium]|nr:hypothetical protein [Burkholderiales bacterium]